jgi:hypothetical protein
MHKNDKHEKYNVIKVYAGDLRSFRPREGDREVRIGIAIIESTRGPLRHSYRDGWAIGPASKPHTEWTLADMEFIQIRDRPHNDVGSFLQLQLAAYDAVSEAMKGPRSTVGDPPGLTHRMDLSRIKE